MRTDPGACVGARPAGSEVPRPFSSAARAGAKGGRKIFVPTDGVTVASAATDAESLWLLVSLGDGCEVLVVGVGEVAKRSSAVT